MRVTKCFRFDAAHHLPGYPGKCAQRHGHGYRLEVTVAGAVRDDGLVFDFYDLKTIVRERVIDRLDHTDLNDLLAMPSAENTLLWIRDQLRDLPLAGLRLYETDDSWVDLVESDLAKSEPAKSDPAKSDPAKSDVAGSDLNEDTQ